MHIAIVTHKVDFNDGQGRVNYEIAMAALEKGHRVTIISDYCSAEIANHPLGRFVPISPRRKPTLLLHALWFSWKSARYLRKHRTEFDILQVNGWVTSVPADVVAVHYVHGAWLRNPHFPYKWWPFNLYAWYQRVTTLVIEHFELKTFNRGHKLVAVSAKAAIEVSQLGIPNDKIAVVHNGVDVSEFRPGEASRPQFGLPVNVPLALFVGDIRTERKNLGTLLKAMVEVPELHLAVAGKLEGSPFPQMATALGIRERVHFLDKISCVPELMRSAEFLIMPSRYETFGMVVLEAMASGLPVILASQVGAVEIAADICPVIEDPDDVSALSAKMRTFLESADSHAGIREVCRSRALEHQWHRTAACYLEIYEECIAARRR